MSRFHTVDQAEADRIEKELEEIIEQDKQFADAPAPVDDGVTVYTISEALLRLFAEHHDFPEVCFSTQTTGVMVRMVQDLKVGDPFYVDEYVTITIPGKRTFGKQVVFDLADSKIAGLKDPDALDFFKGAAKGMLEVLSTQICEGCGFHKDDCVCKKAT